MKRHKLLKHFKQLPTEELKTIRFLINDLIASREKPIPPKKLRPSPPKQTETISDFQKRLIQNATEAEKVFGHFLEEYKFEYEFQRLFLVANKSYFADFALPLFKSEKFLIIELDGGYHSETKQIKRDCKREDDLRTAGHKILRFDNQQIFNMATFKGTILARIRAYCPRYRKD